MSRIRKPAPEQEYPRVVLVGLASCFGCQINITNAEAHLLEVLGQIDMQYWQLTSSDPMPEEFDVAVIEGAVTNEEAVQTVKDLRNRAKVVITIGSCANTAGLPGMASDNVQAHAAAVYADGVPSICGDLVTPAPVSAVIPVDFEVPCCPVDPYDFVRVLGAALYGSNRFVPTSVLCGECKRNERGCFYDNGTMCLGLVTKSGCGARCPNLNRPCNGCAGLSPDANVPAARQVVERRGMEVRRFNDALNMFNQVALTAEQEDE